MIKYRQTAPYGCGLYAVAHACNLDNYVTDARLEASKKGNTIGQLSKWLQEDGWPVSIDVLYYDHVGSKLPESALEYRPAGESVCYLPVLLNVRLSDKGLNHLIGGKIDKDGCFYMYDSLKEEMVVTTLREVNEMYQSVYGLFILMNLEDGSYVFI